MSFVGFAILVWPGEDVGGGEKVHIRSQEINRDLQRASKVLRKE